MTGYNKVFFNTAPLDFFRQRCYCLVLKQKQYLKRYVPNDNQLKQFDELKCISLEQWS